MKTKADTQLLNTVLENIQKHHHFLQEQLDIYKEYLTNVKQQSVSITNIKEDKKKKGKTKPAKGKKQKSMKYSHSQLEKEGIINN